MGVFRRIVADMFDPAAVVTALIFVAIAYFVFSPVVSEIQANLLLYTSPRSAFFAALSDLFSSPLYIIAFLVYGLLNLYVGLVIVGWYGKKRVGHPENPFRRALDVFLSSIVLGIILGAPFFLVFVLFVSTYPTAASWFFAILLAFLIIYYIPVVSPAIPALVIREEGVKDALHEGCFVGRRWWWRILLYTAGAFIILWIFSALLYLLAPLLPPLLIFFVVQALFFVYTYAVITEVYLRDAFGE